MAARMMRGRTPPRRLPLPTVLLLTLVLLGSDIGALALRDRAALRLTDTSAHVTSCASGYFSLALPRKPLRSTRRPLRVPCPLLCALHSQVAASEEEAVQVLRSQAASISGGASRETNGHSWVAKE
eukprot:6205283-Pleurochrysis_carterae.AAC.1